jgi:hypothetical protein
LTDLSGYAKKFTANGDTKSRLDKLFDGERGRESGGLPVGDQAGTGVQCSPRNV